MHIPGSAEVMLMLPLSNGLFRVTEMEIALGSSPLHMVTHHHMTVTFLR